MVNSVLIKARARELGLRQVDIADRLELRQPTLNQKINNIRPMTLEECAKLAEMLKISGNEIVEYFFVGYLIAEQQGFESDRSLSPDPREVTGRNSDAGASGGL